MPAGEFRVGYFPAGEIFLAHYFVGGNTDFAANES
jgi:hypothetical protein